MYQTYLIVHADQSSDDARQCGRSAAAFEGQNALFAKGK